MPVLKIVQIQHDRKIQVQRIDRVAGEMDQIGAMPGEQIGFAMLEISQCGGSADRLLIIPPNSPRDAPATARRFVIGERGEERMILRAGDQQQFACRRSGQFQSFDQAERVILDAAHLARKNAVGVDGDDHGGTFTRRCGPIADGVTQFMCDALLLNSRQAEKHQADSR